MWRAIRLAWRTGRVSDRGVLIHGVYLAEAAVLCRWLKADGVGHVHAHFGTNSTTVAMFCQELGGPTYSFTVHGPEEFDKPDALSLAEKVRRARFVVAISSFCRSQLYRQVEVVHWPKVLVVHCALDGAYFDAPAATPARDGHLVNIGRLSEQKGQMLLVEAVARLRTRGIEAPMVLVGDGPLRATIEARIRELGVADLFELTGWQDGRQIRELLLRSRALVLPSFAEGLPVVIMEAMALGCPVLTTRIAGIPELVVDGETGWLVTAGDIDELSAGIERVVDADEATLRRVSAAAAARVRLRHHAPTEARKIATLVSGPGVRG
jgi:glycosyltransferase involved in cell wall biosynthesis